MTDNKPAQVAISVWRYFLDIILNGVKSMLTVLINYNFFIKVCKVCISSHLSIFDTTDLL